MSFSLVICANCNKKYLKDNRHINENLKLNNHFYCSLPCQHSFKSKKIELPCENPCCRNKFRRQPKSISLHNYCSRSCAVSVNNSKFPKKIAKIRECENCGIQVCTARKFCSMRCQPQSQPIIKSEKIIEQIKRFYHYNGRVPLKREFKHYSAARSRFGTWNKAIIAAGFKPNPVMFADKCIANDGHICDSVAEKIIDDYLSERKIKHERTVPYPDGNYTFDFKIGNIYIEYFGLAGEHKRYDELRKIKQRIVKKSDLQFFEIYPKDLYPHSNLERILGY